MFSLLGQLRSKHTKFYHSNINGDPRLKEQDESIFRRFWQLKIVPKTRRKVHFKNSTASGSELYRGKISQRENHNPRRQKRAAQKKRDCIICANGQWGYDFPSRPPTAECEHPVNVCKRCLRTWISVQYQTQVWNDIKCPTCSSLLTLSDMREFASKDVFKRYLELSARTALEAHPDFLWCGLDSCKSGQVHPPDNPKFECKSCQKAHCIVHNVKWHKDETCEAYDRREEALRKAKEEEASKQILERTTKQCPGCERSIVKISGCDHMYCIKCRCHFCWSCLAPYPTRAPGRRPRPSCGCV